VPKNEILKKIQTVTIEGRTPTPLDSKGVLWPLGHSKIATPHHPQ
jgi:hypothetical protein